MGEAEGAAAQAADALSAIPRIAALMLGNDLLDLTIAIVLMNAYNVASACSPTGKARNKLAHAYSTLIKES
jgi:hypothetical protein